MEMKQNHTCFHGTSGPNLGPFSIQQSDAAPFCEDYAKHLKNELNRDWWNFWCPFWPMSDAALNF